MAALDAGGIATLKNNPSKPMPAPRHRRPTCIHAEHTRHTPRRPEALATPWPPETPEESRHSKTSLQSPSQRPGTADPHEDMQSTHATRRDAPKPWPLHGRPRHRRNRDTQKQPFKAQASAPAPPAHMNTCRAHTPHAATPRSLGHSMAARDAGGIATLKNRPSKPKPAPRHRRPTRIHAEHTRHTPRRPEALATPWPPETPEESRHSQIFQ